MEQTRKARLTEGPVAPTLLRLTLPMILAMFGMVAFNIIDTFFVAKLGTNELAAISFTFPIVMVVASIAMGLGIGTSALISRAIGEGNHQKVQRLTTDALVLSLIIVVFFVVAGLLTIDPLFTLMGATPEILPLIREYMVIWYLGVAFVMVPMVGNNAIRATGDTKTPSLVMLVAVVVNTVMDPLLIFGIWPFPRLELAGAAIASLLARAAIFIVAFWVLFKREKMLTFTPPLISEVLHSWKQVLFIGLPNAGTNLILPLAIGVLTRMVAVYGPAAVAGFGAATRLDPFALIIVFALSSVLSPFVGQNLGAGQHQRIEQGIRYGQIFALAWGIIVFVLFVVAARPIALLFQDDPIVVAVMVGYLSLVPLGYGFQGFVHLTNGVLNVLHRPLHAAALTSVQLLVLLIPLAALGSHLFGLRGIFSAIVLAHTLTAAGSFFVLRRVLATEANERVQAGAMVVQEG